MVRVSVTSLRHGFTLIELSIVMVIIALIVGSGVSMGKSSLDAAKVAATNNRLNAIEAAMMAYRMANNRLPCPADLTLTSASTNFGVEAAIPGNCRGGSPAATYGRITNELNIPTVEGAVPVRALNLPDTFSYDGFGKKIVYSVWAPATMAAAFLSYGARQNCGDIIVKNAAGGDRTISGLYALVSMGKNGHGAYGASGARANAGSTNTDELVNCHCNSSGVATTYAATYVQKDPTQNPSDSRDSFDDIVRYKERWQMATPGDAYAVDGDLTCPGGGFKMEGFSDITAGAILRTGDVNGDHMDDVVVGGGQYISVVYGTQAGFPNPLPLGSLNGTNGFIIDTTNTWFSAIAVGNVTGHDDITDVARDIVIGSYIQSKVYVMRGGSSLTGQAMYTLNDAYTNGVRAFSLSAGGTADRFAYQSLAVGDVNGDDVDDVLIGAPYATYSGGNGKGAVYVVFGGVCPKSGCDVTTTKWPATSNLNSGFLDLGGTGTNGSRINGETNGDEFGTNLTAGRVFSSTIDSLIVAAPGKNAVYVINGQASPWPNPYETSTMDNNHAVRLDGSGVDNNSLGNYPNALAVGNVSGHNNGYEDLLVGSFYRGPGYEGAAYVVLGNNTTLTGGIGTPSHMTVASLMDGVKGFRLDGEMYDTVARSVAVGDINGDGDQDIILGGGDLGVGPDNYLGKAYVVFGGATEKNGTPWPGALTLDPTFLNGGSTGRNGFRANGVVYPDATGMSVAAADLNDDGKDDLIVGAYNSNNRAGAVYVYFGQTKNAWETPYNLGNLCPGC